jgi:hypothetical protein
MLDQISKVEYNGAVYQQQHGNPFDRGSADSYYGRTRCPHKGGVGGQSGPRTEQLTLEERVAYMAGYDWNEEQGDKKNYG